MHVETYVCCISFYVLGKRSDMVTSHNSSKLMEGVDSQHSDGDEDHVQPPPKKRRKEKSHVTKKLSKACKLSSLRLSIYFEH